MRPKPRPPRLRLRWKPSFNSANTIDRWRKACEGKVRFDDYGEAKVAAIYSRRRTHSEIFPYQCDFCDGWHIGHPTGITKVRE